MSALRAACLATLAFSAGACGTDEEPFPVACAAEPQAFAAALERAPRSAALEDGTPVSACVSRVRSDGELQTLGITLTRVADDLAARLPRADAPALQLGYLIGAVRRGARTGTNGIADELVRRLELTVGLDGPPRARAAAFERGLAAGEARG